MGSWSHGCGALPHLCRVGDGHLQRRPDLNRLLRDLCFGNDLTHFFVAEWRAEDVHANVGGDSPQLGRVSGKKALPLDILEKAFETAGGERRREADTLGTISPPGVPSLGKRTKSPGARTKER